MIFQKSNQQNYLQELVNLRRKLHQIPQIGLEQYQTSKFVRNYLFNLQNVSVLDPIPAIPTAVIAVINAQNCSQKYLFRCQLDALSWQQQSGEQFCSKNGLHHACGHDAHMAMILMACKQISKNKSKLKRSIVFCFQPGEQGKGGARKLIQNYPELLESVKYAFAIHGGNHYESGFILASPGVVSANSDRFEILIKGKSCHVMVPNHGIDANYIGCNLVTQLYTLKQLKINPTQGGVLCVTKVQGGLGLATISQSFKIVGSLRMISLKSQQKMRQQIQKLTFNFCKTFEAQCQVKFHSSHYRSVQNAIKPTQIVKQLAKKIFPKQNIREQIASFNGQDFCEFSQRVPSCYMILGVGLKGSFNQNHQSIYPLHSNKHRLDQNFMLWGLKIWIQLAFNKIQQDQ